jgi:hypothetical protein
MKTQSTSSTAKALLRRLLIGMVMLPPMVGVSSISKDEESRPRMKVHANQIVIPGSPSYLDPNPSF